MILAVVSASYAKSIRERYEASGYTMTKRSGGRSAESIVSMTFEKEQPTERLLADVRSFGAGEIDGDELLRRIRVFIDKIR